MRQMLAHVCPDLVEQTRVDQRRVATYTATNFHGAS